MANSEIEGISDRMHHRVERLVKLCRRLAARNRGLCDDLVRQKKMYDEEVARVREVEDRLERISTGLDEEMGMAKSIQEGLMPKAPPELANVKSAAMYIPTEKVGGDLYDMIVTPRDHVAILIFDVSGHGVPAALVGAMAKMLFAQQIEKNESPAEVFREVNRQLCRFIRTEQYLTAFLGILDPEKNVLVYSRAGHVPPLVFHAKDGSLTRLNSKGFFIGHPALLDIAEYEEESLELESGDKILFYTDGLTDGANPDGEMFGLDRLKASLSKSGMCEVNSLLEALLEEQTRFRAGCPLRDDFTMLCIEAGCSEYLLNESGFTREQKPDLLIIKSFNDLEDVGAAVLKTLDKNNYDEQTIKRIKVCMFEMVDNAILHGNKSNPNRKVFLFYKISAQSADIGVIDEGEGFDYTRLPDPLLPENRLKDHGRGLFFIHHYMDEVSFNARGNRIFIRKYRR